MASSSADQDQVLVEEKHSARILTFNRPKQLNAASYYMVSRLFDLFSPYDKDPKVKLVILKGNGRAFCAGGDVAAVVDKIKQGEWKSGEIFFRTEFTLNYLMATFSKPQVSILNGIVLGGGAGCSMHGCFRVSTENSEYDAKGKLFIQYSWDELINIISVYAESIQEVVDLFMYHVSTMTEASVYCVYASDNHYETELGLFPDVGASFFLSRLPGFFGEYLGLTGARLTGAEMLACGLATHYVPSSKLTALEAALCKAESSDPSIISSIIDGYTEQPNLKKDCAYHRLDVINKCFCRRMVEEIISHLEREAAAKTDDWIISSIQLLKKASPTSLKIFLRSIREGRLQGVGKCLIREFGMVCHVLRGEVSKAFVEGCRAILLDKDRNPRWEPSRLDLVTNEMVNKYFTKVDDEDWEELHLPPRANFPAYTIAKL